MKLCVSIPVHEQSEVITNHMENLNYYLDNPVIILHLTAGFRYTPIHSNVFVNPTSYATEWMRGFLRVHRSNIEFMESCDWDYLLINASNEMMIRCGIEKYIEQFDVGIQQLTDNHKDVDYANPRHSQIEGVFFNRKIATTMLSGYEGWPKFPDEEYILPSIIQDMYLDNLFSIGMPTTFVTPYTDESSVLSTIRQLREELINFDTEAYCERYVPEGIFSVKRVPREINSGIRQFLSNEIKESL